MGGGGDSDEHLELINNLSNLYHDLNIRTNQFQELLNLIGTFMFRKFGNDTDFPPEIPEILKLEPQPVLSTPRSEGLNFDAQKMLNCSVRLHRLQFPIPRSAKIESPEDNELDPLWDEDFSARQDHQHDPLVVLGSTSNPDSTFTCTKCGKSLNREQLLHDSHSNCCKGSDTNENITGPGSFNVVPIVQIPCGTRSSKAPKFPSSSSPTSTNLTPTVSETFANIMRKYWKDQNIEVQDSNEKRKVKRKYSKSCYSVIKELPEPEQVSTKKKGPGRPRKNIQEKEVCPGNGKDLDLQASSTTTIQEQEPIPNLPITFTSPDISIVKIEPIATTTTAAPKSPEDENSVPLDPLWDEAEVQDFTTRQEQRDPLNILESTSKPESTFTCTKCGKSLNREQLILDLHSDCCKVSENNDKTEQNLTPGPIEVVPIVQLPSGTPRPIEVIPIVQISCGTPNSTASKFPSNSTSINPKVKISENLANIICKYWENMEVQDPKSSDRKMKARGRPRKYSRKPFRFSVKNQLSVPEPQQVSKKSLKEKSGRGRPRKSTHETETELPASSNSTTILQEPNPPITSPAISDAEIEPIATTSTAAPKSLDDENSVPLESSESPASAPKSISKVATKKKQFKKKKKKRGDNKRIYLCEFCSKTFNSSDGFLYHRRTHTGEKPHLCETCGTRFREPAALRKHWRTHSSEKPFKCNKCEKSFRTRGNLVGHQGNVHAEINKDGEKVKLFNCHICKKSFGEVTTLKRHLLMHTGEKPQKCSQCDKVYRLKHHLTRHQKLCGPRPQPKNQIETDLPVSFVIPKVSIDRSI